MTERTVSQLNPTELTILKVLWTNGRMSAREIHDEVCRDFDWAASTTRTTLERMARKGLLGKELFHGVQLYAAAVSRAAGLAGLIRDFADKVLDGPVAPVLGLVADAGTLSADELAELRALVGDDRSDR